MSTRPIRRPHKSLRNPHGLLGQSLHATVLDKATLAAKDILACRRAPVVTKERFYFYFWSFSDFSTRTGPIPHLDTTITNDQFRSPHTTAAFNPFSQPQGLRLGHWRRQTRVSRVKYHGRETACDVSWKSSSWSMLRSSIPRLVGT